MSARAPRSARPAGYRPPTQGQSGIAANKAVRSMVRMGLVEGAEETAPHQVDSIAQAIEVDVKRFVARELHDQVVQTLTTVLLDMEHFKNQQAGQSSVQHEVSVLQVALRGALNQIRTILYDLRAQPLEDTDFVTAVRGSLIAAFEVRTGIQVALAVSPSWPATLSPRAALNLYRGIQEALNNVRLHAEAHAVRIGLDVSPDGEAIVTVEDDGNGIDDHRRHERRGLGLVGLRERADLLGGELSIRSELGRGTMVRMAVPREGLS